LIGALSADEIVAQQRAAEQSKLLAAHRSKSERLAWQIERSHEELAAAFSLTDFVPGTPLACDGFKAAAVAALSKILDLPTETTTTDLQTARNQHQSAQQEFQRIKAEYEGVAIRIEEREKTASYMQSELPEAHARLTKENNPICPICEVPIDRALAQGCGISTATCDLEALHTRVAKLREQIQSRQQEIAQLKSERAELKSSLERARERVEPAARTLAALERNIYQRSTAIREAQRLVDDAERYERLTQERSAAAVAADSVSGQLESTREMLSAHRIAVAESITYLSGWFDTTMRELVPGEIKATARLDGNGLTLKVELGGERSTAAIDSLKVVAFDLAVLIMSIQGRSRFPGFLIHDSPREADLGLSIYSRLFAFARKLESFGPSPLFQYIVTTTTEPPPDFRDDNWLRLTVHGAPASERLLRVDL
jgi:uncharacterized protein YydD (DUF2326 family)